MKNKSVKELALKKRKLTRRVTVRELFTEGDWEIGPLLFAFMVAVVLGLAFGAAAGEPLAGLIAVLFLFVVFMGAIFLSSLFETRVCKQCSYVMDDSELWRHMQYRHNIDIFK